MVVVVIVLSTVIVGLLAIWAAYMVSRPPPLTHLSFEPQYAAVKAPEGKCSPGFTGLFLDLLCGGVGRHDFLIRHSLWSDTKVNLYGKEQTVANAISAGYPDGKIYTAMKERGILDDVRYKSEYKWDYSAVAISAAFALIATAAWYVVLASFYRWVVLFVAYGRPPSNHAAL